MFFLKRMVASWVDEVRNERSMRVQQPAHTQGQLSNRKNPNEEDDTFKNPLNITLYNAVGGRIIKFTHWDRDHGKAHETTYVIDADQNFEEALGQFITIEAMKHVG